MVLIGVILVLLAAAAGVVLIAGTAQLTDSVQIDVLGGTLSIPPLTLLITGMIVISVFWLGWVLLRGGLRRGKRRRVEAKEAAAAAEAKRVEEQKRMQDEFAAREQALTEERRRREEAESLVADQRATTTTTATDTTPVSGDTGRATDPAAAPTVVSRPTPGRGTATARSSTDRTARRRSRSPPARVDHTCLGGFGLADRRPSRRLGVDHAGPGPARHQGRQAAPAGRPAVPDGHGDDHRAVRSRRHTRSAPPRWPRRPTPPTSQSVPSTARHGTGRRERREVRRRAGPVDVAHHADSRPAPR